MFWEMRKVSIIICLKKNNKQQFASWWCVTTKWIQRQTGRGWTQSSNSTLGSQRGLRDRRRVSEPGNFPTTACTMMLQHDANYTFVLYLRFQIQLVLCAVLSRLSHVWFFTTLWTIACQAALSMGFSRQEYLRRLPCPPPGDLPNPGVEPASFTSPVLACGFFTTSAIWEAPDTTYTYFK